MTLCRPRLPGPWPLRRPRPPPRSNPATNNLAHRRHLKLQSRKRRNAVSKTRRTTPDPCFRGPRPAISVAHAANSTWTLPSTNRENGTPCPILAVRHATCATSPQDLDTQSTTPTTRIRILRRLLHLSLPPLGAHSAATRASTYASRCLQRQYLLTSASSRAPSLPCPTRANVYVTP